MIISLLRINQWYKNLLIFLPILFVKELFNFELLSLTFWGFIALCLISSSGYIINDIVDRNKDKFHPEKKSRPIASGKIGLFSASIIALLLFLVAVSISYMLNFIFLIFTVGIFVLMQIYSFLLKNEAFADIIVIATNFVLRAASGAFIIEKTVSPWLILGIFFLSLFLSVGKRKADIMFLKKEAKNHKKTLSIYSIELTDAIMIISTSSLVLSYSLFSFLSIHKYLIFSLPFALYTIFYYFYLIYSGSEIARHPHLTFKNPRMFWGMVMWLMSVIVLVYI